MIELSAEMKAEGWTAWPVENEAHGPGEWGFIMWQHVPSQRCLTVDGCRRSTWDGPVWGVEPPSPEADGYCVVLRVHDEWGNPVSGEGFWLQSLGLALKLATKIRSGVLEGRFRPGAVQLTLDDIGGSP